MSELRKDIGEPIKFVERQNTHVGNRGAATDVTVSTQCQKWPPRGFKEFLSRPLMLDHRYSRRPCGKVILWPCYPSGPASVTPMHGSCLGRWSLGASTCSNDRRLSHYPSLGGKQTCVEYRHAYRVLMGLCAVNNGKHFPLAPSSAASET